METFLEPFGRILSLLCKLNDNSVFKRDESMKLKVATCQFPTSSDITGNYNQVASLVTKAKERGADVAHFPEACLSGYAGSDNHLSPH